MDVQVVADEGGHRVSGEGCADLDLVNAFLAHLSVRYFSLATRRAYAYDLLTFLRFLSSRHQLLGELRSTDLFDYLELPRPGRQPRPRRDRHRPTKRNAVDTKKEGTQPAGLLMEAAVAGGRDTDVDTASARCSAAGLVRCRDEP
jgi:hypothetical protein